MEVKIFDLLNDVQVNLDEYDTQDLSPEEKKQVQERVLREVKNMRKNNHKNGMKKGWKIAGIAAAACVAVSAVAVGSNPVAARALLSETFQKIISGVEGKKNGDELQEIYTKIGKESVSVKAGDDKSILKADSSGIKMQVSDIYCDGYMLYYTLVLETDQRDLLKKEIDGISTFSSSDKKNPPATPACCITIDGEEDEWPIGFQKQADGTFTSVQNYSLYTAENPKEYKNGDTIPVEVDIHKFYGYDYDKHDKDGEYMGTKPVDGNWKLSFPVIVDTSSNHTEKIGKEENGIKVIEATRTKATLNLVIEEPDYSKAPYNDPYNDPDIFIQGEDGKDIKWLGGYMKEKKDGSKTSYITLLDCGGENFRLQVTNKNGDGEKFADINFKVKEDKEQ